MKDGLPDRDPFTTRKGRVPGQRIIGADCPACKSIPLAKPSASTRQIPQRVLDQPALGIDSATAGVPVVIAGAESNKAMVTYWLHTGLPEVQLSPSSGLGCLHLFTTRITRELPMLLRLLKRIGSRRPYFNIYGDDGSLYMGRWWIFGGSGRDRPDQRPADQPKLWRSTPIDALIGSWIALRLHHIARADRGRDNHTHPASFISFVVSGWYRERRPLSQRQSPTLDGVFYVDVIRRPGSIAFRRASDRHTIVEVGPNTYTAVLWFKKVGSWGFWLKSTGEFVNWRDYRGAA